VSRVLLPAATLWWREMVRFVRQRSRVIGAFGQPLVIWLLLGSGVSATAQPPGAPAGIWYLQYFFPGSIALMVLFTAIFATISVIEDRREGFLQGVLVAPVARATVVLGQALGGTTLALLQGLVFLLLAPLAGIGLTVASVAAVAAVMVLMGFGLTSLGLVIAWRVESTQGFHAIMNMVLLPMWFLSGATFPGAGAPWWLEWAMRLNPLTYGVAALRRCLHLANPSAAGPVPSLALSLALTLAFALVAYVAATRAASRRAV
jgi:ABC-2 type transport system permease protein